jgi:DNA repair protein RadD
VTDIDLRPYQTECVQQLRDGIRAGHPKQILMAPAGAGKTEIAAFLIKEAQRKFNRAMFIVDRVVLCDQTSDRFDRYGIPHGVHQGNHWRWRPYERVQVCSAQTLEKRKAPDADLIVVDEAHCMRKSVSEIVQGTNAKVIGLTATPFSKGLGKLYSNLVNVTTTNALIADGFLCQVKAYAAKSPDMTGAKIIAGEWAEDEIERRGTEIIGDIVSEWVEKTRQHFGGPVKTIVFSATVSHGEEIVKRFTEAGFNFQQISYKEGSDERRKTIIDEFKKADSTIHGLVSCEVFTKGFDVPDILCGISARPYRKSLSSHIQQLGRVMRPSPGKSFGLWLDHAGNYLRFYKDTMDVFENGMNKLDDGEHDAKVRKEPTDKEKSEVACKCGYVLLPWHKVCPACGKEVKRRSLVETLPGELVEVNGAALEKMPQWMRDKKAVWYQLCNWAWDKKESDEAAARKLALAKYRSWYNDWPAMSWGFALDRADITADLVRKIRADNIRWAKSREAQARMAA